MKMKFMKNVMIIVMFVFVFQLLSKTMRYKTLKKVEQKLNEQKEGFQTNIQKKTFKSTENPLEFNKMVVTNGDGSLSSIGCPKGVIWLWSGSIENIPDGWALCNGENGTPDLRGRFVLGVNTNTKKNGDFMVNEMNAKGGSETHNHKYFDTMYAEKWGHKATTKALIKHPEFSVDNNIGSSGTDNDNTFQGIWRFTGEDQTSKGTDEGGRIFPPYFTLAYIMKIV